MKLFLVDRSVPYGIFFPTCRCSFPATNCKTGLLNIYIDDGLSLLPSVLGDVAVSSMGKEA